MAELKTRIQLLRKSQSELESQNPLTLRGEIYIVDCGDSNPLRYKVGAEGKYFNEVPYFDNSNGIIVHGNLFNDKFYTDSTYQNQLIPHEAHLYIDNNSKQLYTWDGTDYRLGINQASASAAGIVFLYDQSGQATNGTMTQKAITNGVAAIKFGLDDEQDECLILDLPWTGV